MVLGLAGDGNQTTNGSVQQLFNQSSVNHYGAYIYTNNMQSGDELGITVFVLDSDGVAIRKYLDVKLTGVQVSPAVFIPFIPTGQYQLKIQRLAGADRNYTWQVWTA